MSRMLEVHQIQMAALLGAACVAALIALRCLRCLWQIISIERGLRGVSKAPGGNILIGHVLPLLKGTPWNIMAAWVMDSPPLVRLAPILSESLSAWMQDESSMHEEETSCTPSVERQRTDCSGHRRADRTSCRCTCVFCSAQW